MSGKHDKIQAFVQSLPVSNRDGDPRYLAYFQCFNSGLYYEAHDVLEDLWLELRRTPRDPFYKGLIQFAGAFVHLQKGRLHPASALFNLSQKYLAPFRPTFKSLNVDHLCALATHWDHLLKHDHFRSNPLTLHPPPQLTLQHQLSAAQEFTRPHASVVVFCKTPRPGLAKTRIAHRLGPEKAHAIYQQLLLHTLNACYPFPHVTLQYTPQDADSIPDLQPWILRPDWKLQPQIGPDLGARLFHATQSSLQTQPQGVLIIGSDCPHVRASDLAEAWIQLTSPTQIHDLILGPASDGGYWLIGLKQPHPELFEGIHWSTEHVLQQTLARAAQSRLRVHTLRTLEDIDTVEAWERWDKARFQPMEQPMITSALNS